MAVEINDVTDKTIRKKKQQKAKKKTKKRTKKKKTNSHCDMKPPYNFKNKAKTYKVYFEVRWKGEFG